MTAHGQVQELLDKQKREEEDEEAEQQLVSQDAVSQLPGVAAAISRHSVTREWASDAPSSALLAAQRGGQQAGALGGARVGRPKSPYEDELVARWSSQVQRLMHECMRQLYNNKWITWAYTHMYM